MDGRETHKTELDIRYIAGFIDGEGCISITKTKKRMAGGADRYFPYLAISNTNLSILQELQALYPVGRKISVRPKISNRRQCYGIRWDGNELRRFLQDLIPHLREKKLQAILVLEFMETLRCKHEHRKKIPEEIIQIREGFYQRLKRLKKDPIEANLPLLEASRKIQ